MTVRVPPHLSLDASRKCMEYFFEVRASYLRAYGVQYLDRSVIEKWAQVGFDAASNVPYSGAQTEIDQGRAYVEAVEPVIYGDEKLRWGGPVRLFRGEIGSGL